VWQRIRHPELYSVKIGTAQRGIKLRVTLEEACLIQAPPRQGKTAALLADIVLRYPGPAVSTSVKPDVFAMTSGVRYKLGPVEVFNPQNIGGVPSTIAWSPTSGCRDPQVAERRASAFAGAVSLAEPGGRPCAQGRPDSPVDAGRVGHERRQREVLDAPRTILRF
jgi:type IV secretion system protein VirD4